MAMEQYFEEAVPQNDFGREDKFSSVEKQKSEADAVAESNDSPSGGFDCNICLDCVQDPVVTLCGHLFCWPCIYKWIHFQSISQDQKQQQQQCPVCKAEVSADTLVPLYGRGKTAKPSNGKAPQLGMVIPQRPLGPVCGVISPRSPGFTMSPHLPPQPQTHHHNHHPQQSNHYYSQPGSYLASPMSSPSGTTTNVFDPMIGEMVYSRLFGNSIINTYPNTYNLAGSTSPRMRRHIMQADKSLNRICSFLFCCIFLCLLLF